MHPNPACIRQDMTGKDRPILLKTVGLRGNEKKVRVGD